MSEADGKPDNLPGTGKPWEPDYSHTDPDLDMEGPHYHFWLLQHDHETLAPFYSPRLPAYRTRGNAYYHAKKWAYPSHGTAGMLVLKCKGNTVACPAWQYQRRLEAEDAS